MPRCETLPFVRKINACSIGCIVVHVREYIIGRDIVEEGHGVQALVYLFLYFLIGTRAHNKIAVDIPKNSELFCNKEICFTPQSYKRCTVQR